MRMYSKTANVVHWADVEEYMAVPEAKRKRVISSRTGAEVGFAESANLSHTLGALARVPERCVPCIVSARVGGSSFSGWVHGSYSI